MTQREEPVPPPQAGTGLFLAKRVKPGLNLPVQEIYDPDARAIDMTPPRSPVVSPMRTSNKTTSPPSSPLSSPRGNPSAHAQLDSQQQQQQKHHQEAAQNTKPKQSTPAQSPPAFVGSALASPVKPSTNIKKPIVTPTKNEIHNSTPTKIVKEQATPVSTPIKSSPTPISTPTPTPTKTPQDQVTPLSTPTKSVTSPASPSSPDSQSPRGHYPTLDPEEEIYSNFRTFSHNRRAVTRLKFGRDSGFSLAWASNDRTLSVVNLAQPDQPHTVFKGHKAEITDLDWSVTDDYVLTCSLDKTMRVWDVKHKKSMHVYEHASPLLCCSFHPINNNTVAIGTQECCVDLWNFSTGKEIMSYKLKSEVKCLTFSSNGHYLFTGCANGKIYWFKFLNKEFNSFKPHGKFKVTLGRPVCSISYRDKHPRGPTIPSLLINSSDSTAKLYRFIPAARQGADTKNCLKLWMVAPALNVDNKIHSSFCPLIARKGKVGYFITGSEGGSISCYAYPIKPDASDAEAVNFKEAFCLSKGHGKETVLDVAWNSGGTILASCDSGGKLLLWRKDQKQ